MILVLLSLIPILLISPFVYPFSDDFTFATYSRMAVTNSTSLPQMIGTLLHHAIINTYDSYVEWQGTFTTTFLMAFCPAIFGYRYYHLVPVIIIAIYCLALFYFLYVIICRIAHAPRYVAVFIFALTSLFTIQNSPDPMQAFNWFSSAVPYTVGNAIWLFFFARQLTIALHSFEGRQISFPKQQLPLCVLAFLTGGINHITIVWAFMILVTMWIVLFLLKTPRTTINVLIPSSLFLLVGLAANVLCPGSRLRMDASGGTANGFLATILKSFRAGAIMSIRWADPTIILYVVLLIPFILVLLEHFCRHSHFHFPLPGLFCIYAYCLFSGLFAPLIYVSDRYDTRRPHTASHPLYLLLLLLCTVYVAGYIRTHYRQSIWVERLSSVIRAPMKYYMFSLAATLLVCLFMTVQKPTRFFSMSCLVSLLNGNAKEFGEIMEYNFRQLEDPSVRNVQVRHVPLNSSALTSDEVADWKDGAVLFYQKESVYYVDGAPMP